MLTEIRDRSSGWFAWIIAALIIIPMAFWGVNEYATTDVRPVLAQVGEQKIYQDQFQQQLANQQQRATQANPSLANSDIFNSDFYKRGVLQSMVNRSLIQHVAAEQNYQIGDDQLAELIKQDPIFQTEGKFDPSLYQNYLASSGLFSKKQFEDNIRQSSRIQQVSAGYQESAIVLPDELRAILEIQAEKRTFDLITVNQADFTDKVEVNEQDIESYYNQNTANYMNPDRRSVEYVELDTSLLAEGLEVSDEEIQTAYDDYVASFSADETRNTRHILLSVGGDKKDAAQLEKANALVTQLRAGGDFAELAKENSDDPGSAANGGSLGEVERGVMVPEFEEATFAAEVGAISDPIKTQFGYHIIQVESINATEARSIDEMRFELAEDARQIKAEDLAAEKAEDLRNILFDQRDSLSGAAELLGVEVKTSGLFSQDNGSGIAANAAVRNAAFGDEVTAGNNSELIELGNGLSVAVRQKELVASAPKPLTEVSEQIKASLTSERAAKAAEEAGASLLVRAEGDWASLAKDEEVEIKTFTVSLIDTERKASPDVIREVTKMQLRDTATELNSFASPNGDFNIVRLHKIEPGNLADVSQQVKDATRRTLEARNGQSLFTAYLKGLEEQVVPQINEDLL